MELTNDDIKKIRDALMTEIQQRIDDTIKNHENSTVERKLDELSKSMQSYVDGEIAKLRAYIDDAVNRAVNNLEVQRR